MDYYKKYRLYKTLYLVYSQGGTSEKDFYCKHVTKNSKQGCRKTKGNRDDDPECAFVKSRCQLKSKDTKVQEKNYCALVKLKNDKLGCHKKKGDKPDSPECEKKNSRCRYVGLDKSQKNKGKQVKQEKNYCALVKLKNDKLGCHKKKGDKPDSPECEKKNSRCRYVGLRDSKKESPRKSPRQSTQQSPRQSSSDSSLQQQDFISLSQSDTPENDNVNIQETENYIKIQQGGMPSEAKIAGFDMDYTLIKTKSGNKFPKNSKDWKFWCNSIVDKLQDISETHYVVVFTNQKSSCKKSKKQEIIEKIKDIVSYFNFDCCFYISTENDYYRKPFTGLWKVMEDSVVVDKNNSFYCGDAAGRKGDFAATDLMFAHNLRIRFVTPDEFFLHEKQKIDFKLSNDILKYQGTSNPEDIELPDTNKILILMFGYPGSGKSTVAKSLTGFNIISRDYLKTQKKCLEETQKIISQNKKVVIDNTNIDEKSREPYITLAKNNGYLVYCIEMTNSIEFCYYMNQVRVESSKSKCKMIPKIVYYTMRKKYQKPSNQEGIDEILPFTTRVPEFKYLFPPL